MQTIKYLNENQIEQFEYVPSGYLFYLMGDPALMLPFPKSSISESVINENFEERARQSFERELSDALIEKVGVETPPSMVENYLNNILEDVKKQNNGEPIEEEKVLETYRPSAERNLKWYLIRKKVINQEQINIERKDIDAEIENLVSRSPNSEKEIRRFYKKPSNRQRIEDDMVEKKILEYLNQFAKVKEVEVNTKDIRGENK